MSAVFGACCLSASEAKPLKYRRDVPWVSLEHQRKLEAERLAAAKSAQADKKDASAKKEVSKKSGLISKFSGGGDPVLSADKFDYADDASGKLIARGSARLFNGKAELNADEIEVSRDSGDAVARGDVRACADIMRLATDELKMNFQENKIAADRLRLGTYPVYVDAQGVSGDRNRTEIGKGRIFFGEPSWLSMGAEASEMSYDSESEMLEMEDVTLRFGELPFFYIPYYSQEELEKPPFNLITQVGMNNDYGAFIRNTFYYNGLGSVDPGLLLDYYTKRSVLFGPAANYEAETAEAWLKGWLQGAYINDNGGEDILGVDDLGRKITRHRFFAEWRGNHMIGDRIGFNANINYWSDQFVTRDFRPELFYDNQTPDNFGEVTYYGDSFTASVFTRFAPNSWEIVQQRLPEARFDLQPVEILKTGAYQTMFVSAGYYRKADPTGLLDTLTSSRIDAYYGISRPIQLNSWSKITPVIGGRLTSYTKTLKSSGTYTRLLGQIGFDAQMDAWGVWDWTSETMGIDGLRHHITPIMSYRYIPKAEQGLDYIPEIDTDYLTTYPPILDLGTLRNVDQIYNTNTLRIGVQNVFETRDAEYGSREIARFDVFQDFNFEPRPLPQAEGLRSFSDLYVNASVSPARWLTIGTYSRFNFDLMNIPEVDTYIGLFDGDEFSVYLISTYLMGGITQYSVQAEYKVSERVRLLGRWHYDYYENMLTEQTYGVWTRMGNSWIVEYYVSNRSGSTRQNNFSFGVRVGMAMF